MAAGRAAGRAAGGGTVVLGSKGSVRIKLSHTTHARVR